MKYRLYAAAARESGNEALARLFEDFANNESEHAELILEYLDGITDDKGNLEALIAAEDYARGVSYPEFANIAMSEGFSEIAEKMRNIAKAEERHSKVLSETLERLASTPETLPAAMLCPVCGYVHEGDSLPDRCPLCSRPSFNFMPM